MALTPTKEIPLGFKAPDFTLPDVLSKKNLSLQDLASDKATVIMFICNHCPYVIHVMEEIVRVAQDYQESVSFVAISSNDVENYPADSPENMKVFAQKYQFPFPYLYDESQAVAKAYEAACTPDFNVFDAELNCVYRGQLDGARPGNQVKLNGQDLRAALDAVLAGKELPKKQIPSMGCNIKWKASSK